MPDAPLPLGPARRFWVTILALSALAIVAGGIAYSRYETQRIRRDKYEDIATIASLKRDQIAQWRKERLADAWRAANGPLVVTLLAEWSAEKNPLLRDELKKLLEINLKGDLYANVSLIDSNGTVLLAARASPALACPETKRTIEAALSNRRPLLSDVCRHPADGIVHLDAVAAVPPGKGSAGVTMVLQSRMETGLFPLLQSWPIPSDSAEVMLVKREGGTVVVVNELRHQTNTALTLRFPVANDHNPAVQAALGSRGPYLGPDYRNAEVLADLSSIPGTDWLLAAQVDASEILAEARYRTAGIAIVAVLFILLAAAVTTFAYRQQQAFFFRNLYQLEREQREAQEIFRTTFHSIADAVITTDTTGRVREMNPVAEALTGWSREDARGKPLEDVFRIVNEETRRTVENPVQRVLREGRVAGLANHTLLLSRKGAARPIADSAAPIRAGANAVTGVVLVFRDQTGERAAQNALQESEARMSFALETTGIGAWDLNLLDHTAHRSLIHDRIFGYEPLLPNWTFEQFLDHVIPEDRPAVELRFNAAVSSQAGLNFECRIRRIDNEIRWIWVAGNHQCDAAGKTVRMAGVVEDITDRKRREEQLLKTTHELARSNRELEQFAYIAAHDLREPLRMVSAFSGLLQKRYRDRLDETANQYIAFAVDGAERMAALITGLLEYSRVGKRESVKEVNAEMPIREALANMKTVLDETGAAVEIGPMPVITVNAMQATQLFQNLIGNAIKFRGQATPQIRISASRHDGEWRFSVQDNGIGIDPQYGTRIFEVFQRLHTQEKYPGTGIGLAICKKIVENHGGRIWVDSKPGTGSTFFFTLPG